MASIVVTHDAELDLEEIDRFSFGEFSPDVAQKYMAGFDGVFARLADHPASGPVYDGIEPAIRCVTYRSHKIFYDIDEDRVIVIRILHQAMNAARHLKS